MYQKSLLNSLVLLPMALCLSAGTLLAQTEETLRYQITTPVGTSLGLEGTLTLPANTRQPVPVVMLIAGSGPVDRNGNAPPELGGPQMNMYRQLADSLARRGVAVLRYDKRGSGQNRAAFLASALAKQPGNFDDNVTDALGFIRQLQADKRFSTLTVAGHSEGALVGMLAVARSGVSRYVSIAGPGRNIAEILKTQFTNGGVTGEALTLATGVLDSLRAGFAVRQPPFVLARFFAPAAQPYFISWMKYNPTQAIKAIRGRVLILQGRRDIQVDVSEALLLKNARPDADLVFFETMSHILKEAPADRAANMATYTDPNRTILPALADMLAAFAKKK